MLRRAFLLAAVLGLAAAYSTGNYNDNDRYNNNNYYNNNNQYQQSYNNSQQRTKDIFCFLNVTNIARHAYHEVNSETKGPFTINTMKPELCTHIVYNAVELDPRTNNVRPIDPSLERDSGSQPTFAELVHLKERNRHLKLILSVSGMPVDFSNLARDSQRLPQFINNVNQYLTRIKFDGVNIDWRYPKLDERTAFTTFMTNLKSTLRSHGRLLTTVLHPHKTTVQDIYEQQQELFEMVDYWFIMAIDLNPRWYKITAPAPMRSSDAFNIVQSVTDLKRIFAQHSYKLILAIPFGGKQMTTNHEIIELDITSGKGKAIQEEPFAYNQLCKQIRNGWKLSWSDNEQVPYAHHGNRLFTYEDAESVKIKTLYAMREGLGGVMAYTIDMDDYEGVCTNSGPGYSNRKYNDQTYRGSQDRSSTNFPLLQSMYDTIQRGPNSAGLHTSSLALVLAIAFAMILKHNA